MLPHAQELLAQPAALVRAALFLRDAHNWRRGGAARAFVAAGPPNAQGWCHIASVADPPQGGAQQVPSQLYRNLPWIPAAPAIAIVECVCPCVWGGGYHLVDGAATETKILMMQ